MAICIICDVNDTLQQCPQCKKDVCRLCIKYEVCDVCYLANFKYPIQYEQHQAYMQEQRYQLSSIQEKINTLNEEISLIQRAGEYLRKNAKSESHESLMSETILDKQHELEDEELKVQHSKQILDEVNSELNAMQSQKLKFTTQNQELDLKIADAEREYEIAQETGNLKKQQIMQILQTLKNKTSLIRGTYDMEKHYSQSNMRITGAPKQQKAISSEEKVQQGGYYNRYFSFCAGQCKIQ